MSKTTNKIQFIFIRLKTIDVSHNKLKMEIHGEVYTLLIYKKLNKKKKKKTKFNFYLNLIKKNKKYY